MKTVLILIFPSIYRLLLITMKKLPAETCCRIVLLLQEKMFARAVAKEVGVSHTMVNKVRKEAMLDALKPKRGRPKILSVRDKKWLVKQITSCKADAATKLRKELADGANVCASDSIHVAIYLAGVANALGCMTTPDH